MDIPSEFLRFPKEWNVIPFCNAIEDVTGGNHKIKKEDYLSSGILPIVDQGQSKFAGYTNDLSLACNIDLPAIVFGDHTRTFKFITEPFAIGADGVKLLTPKVALDKTFLFFYLKQLNIESAGYSRHFKFLKETYIPLPPLETQKQIAQVLETADQLRKDCQQVEQELNALAQSVFLEMFGDPLFSHKQWKKDKIKNFTVSSPTNGLYKHSSEYGQGYPIIRINNFYSGYLTDASLFNRLNVTQKELDKFKVTERSIVINRVNSPEYLGKSVLIEGLTETTVFESNMMNFTVNENLLNARFLVDLLGTNYLKKQIKTASKDAVNQSSINQKDVNDFEIILPPIELQNSYEEIIKKNFLQKNINTQKENHTNNLFNALLQKAFKGELNLKSTEQA